MKNVIKHLWLVVGLIVAASLLLLMSDRGQRTVSERKSAREYPSIAVMQIVSTIVLDDHIAGVVSRVAEKGYRAPDGKNIRRYNAHGDFGTANSMAREIVNSPVEMIITSSTVALQVLAKANISTQKAHVFGAVTDPYGTGTGITGPAADQHPPHLAGIGSFQPVKNAIKLAHEMNPELGRLGVVWNPGEQCSEACLIQGREIANVLGIQMVEAIATNTTEVAEATRSLLAKEVDAIWIGGDTVASASIGLIIHLAEQAGVPVFTNDPKDAEKGALFGLGADYFTVGQYTADMAIAILEGQNPSTFRIENVVPEQLGFNQQLLARLDGLWHLSPSVKTLLSKQAATETKPLAPEPGVTYRIGLSYIVPAPIFELAIQGFKDGLRDLGFVEGKNLEITSRHANGDMSLLPQTTSSLIQQNPDVLVAMSTLSLSSAIAHADGRNIVFGIVSAPLEAGAGDSFDDHLPNVTGIVQLMPTEDLFDWAQRLFPQIQRIGVL